jgi:peptidoglycan/LPS O-acetylase OafA/YrhL
MTPENAQKAKIALVKLFMGGAVGAFFVALASDIPVDIQSLTVITGQRVNWTHTLDRAVRYEYLLWFLIYFWVSDFRREKEEAEPTFPSPYDVFFYLAQCVLSLGAVFYLGMLVPQEGFKRYGCAVLAGDIAIGLICLFSLKYRNDEEGNYKLKLNALRVVALLLACISGCCAYLAPQRPSFWYMMLLVLLAASLLLVASIYVGLRLAASD